MASLFVLRNEKYEYKFGQVLTLSLFTQHKLKNTFGIGYPNISIKLWQVSRNGLTVTLGTHQIHITFVTMSFPFRQPANLSCANCFQLSKGSHFVVVVVDVTLFTYHGFGQRYCSCSPNVPPSGTNKIKYDTQLWQTIRRSIIIKWVREKCIHCGLELTTCEPKQDQREGTRW